MNKVIKYLIESFEDLFKDLYDEQDYNDSTFTDIFKNNIFDLLIHLLGIDKPRGWKKEKINNEECLTISMDWKHDSTVLPKYVENVVNELMDKNFKEYRSFFNFAYSNNYKNLLDYQNPKVRTTTYDYTKLQKDNKKYLNELKQLKSAPQYVQNLFKNNETYRRIWLSEDSGIVVIYEDNLYLDNDFTWKTRLYNKCKATIKLTGLVNYTAILDTTNNKNIIKNTKEQNKKITILKTAIREQTQTLFKYFKLFKLDNEGYPISIYKFNWDDEVKSGIAKYKKLNLPGFINKIFNHSSFEFVPKFEKEDPNSFMELNTDKLNIKIYKQVFNEHDDSYMIIELGGFFKEQYKNIYLNKED